MSADSQKSLILKIALFATGLSGIVAEYILSTLASYFLGDSILQWTMTVSTMLFSMGLGSRLSQYVHKNLLEKLIFTEFLLSITVAFVALIVYVLAAWTSYVGFFIYFLSIAVGAMIGLEIPLVTRINEAYESLRVNIAAVMEKDYYGSLVGGAFFAFVGLPYLGLTYTPFILGITNFSVAVWLYLKLKDHVEKRFIWRINLALGTSVALLVAGLFLAKPIVLYGEQAKYKDQVVFTKQSSYQKIVLTQWKENYWLFINGNQQLSTLDEFLYHEPLIHPIMQMVPHATNVLVLGGGDGCAAREILQYPKVEKITVVDLDPMMTDLAKENPIFVGFNDNSMNNPKVKIINQDGFQFLEQTQEFFDVIIVDLPDPKTVEINKLYTNSFYELTKRQLRPHGLLITQAGSPYYATKAFRCVERTMQSVGLNTVPMHNQILTMGQWGWLLASKETDSESLKKRLQSLDFQNVRTRWITKEGMMMITSFGKDLKEVGEIEINTIHNPVLQRYYLKGNWDLF